jgi:flavin-binding protein dodecin
MEECVTDHIESGAIKVIEVIGISTAGFDDAVQRAVAKASESISGITGVEVQSMSAKVTDGRITQYRAALKLAFVVK